MNIPIFNETPIGRPPHDEVSVCRAITMTFDEDGNAVGNFNSIPFRVKEIRVLNASYDDDNSTEGYAILWCDLFQTTPVSLIGLTVVQTSTDLFQYTPTGHFGSKIQFNPPRDVEGQISFRLTQTNYEKTPYTPSQSGTFGCVIMEFIRGE